MNIRNLKKNSLITAITILVIISCQKNNVIHFNASIEYSNKSASIINQGEDYTLVDSDSMAKIINFYQQALLEAKQVDINILNNQFDGFGNHYKQEFVNGLEILIEGYEKHNQDRFLQGEILLDKWSEWYYINIDSIRYGKN